MAIGENGGKCDSDSARASSGAPLSFPGENANADFSYFNVLPSFWLHLVKQVADSPRKIGVHLLWSAAGPRYSNKVTQS